MELLDLREPINALSHGVGMIAALPVTWLLWKPTFEQTRGEGGTAGGTKSTAFYRGKALCLLLFGLSLVICYGNSALFHAVRVSGEPLNRYRRLDHAGIYLLIAGSYTPVAWTLMRGAWKRGTLTTVWSLAALCAGRVWFAGVLPPWASTLVYLTLGWGALFCYRELARTFDQKTLFALPLGGVFYSVGAMINLAGRPILSPGVFASHELFHFFVLAGSACHIAFMYRVVVPAMEPLTGPGVPGLSGMRPHPSWSHRRHWAQTAGTLVQRPHHLVGSSQRVLQVLGLGLRMGTGARASLRLELDSVEGARLRESSAEPGGILNPADS